MPVNVHRRSRHNVAHRFVVEMSPVDERPAHGVNKLLSFEKQTRGEDVTQHHHVDCIHHYSTQQQMEAPQGVRQRTLRRCMPHASLMYYTAHRKSGPLSRSALGVKQSKTTCLDKRLCTRQCRRRIEIALSYNSCGVFTFQPVQTDESHQQY